MAASAAAVVAAAAAAAVSASAAAFFLRPVSVNERVKEETDFWIVLERASSSSEISSGLYTSIRTSIH